MPGFLQSAKGQGTLLIVAFLLVVFSLDGAAPFVKCRDD